MEHVPNHTPLDDLDDKIIMLDEISSTQNIGSIARSAAAIGINSYLLTYTWTTPLLKTST